MDERVAGQQSLQSGAVESGEKRAIQDFFPAPPLAIPGEVFQMLGLRMHDVEVGWSRCEGGILRAGRQSLAELVFWLVFHPLAASHSGMERIPRRLLGRAHGQGR
jgi:hypothetical protein